MNNKDEISNNKLPEVLVRLAKNRKALVTRCRAVHDAKLPFTLTVNAKWRTGRRTKKSANRKKGMLYGWAELSRGGGG
jgi:hypothetical protein